MTPTAEERDTLFKTFGRAFFKRDAGLLYEAVTPDFTWMTLDEAGAATAITGRDEIADQLQ